MSNLINKFSEWLLSFYHFKATFLRNIYPLRVENINVANNKKNSVYITFKIRGTKDFYTLPLNEILKHPNIVGCFQPTDAFKFGQLSYDIIINKYPRTKYKRFEIIRHYMLESNGRIISQFSDNNCFLNDHILSLLQNPLLKQAQENFYPYRLVGGKIHKNEPSDILYIMFGKREAFIKPALDIIRSNLMFNKFHPTDLVKLGFISRGEKIKQEDTNFEI